jgi:hypothetical protein
VIGVSCHPEERAVFGEFFELFKTPWELYERGRAYEVVLTTTGDGADADAGLLVIYGAAPRRGDERIAPAAGAGRRGGAVRYRGARLPIQGRLLTFLERIPGTAFLTTADGAVAGVRVRAGDRTVVRVGYDLAEEVRALLSAAQAPTDADVPTLDLHVEVLRTSIVEAGLLLVEIPPVPAGHPFAACLTHDIDFAGIRYHRFDHTMWGFLYRATVGALRRVLRGRLTLGRCLQSWRAVASLPLVYLGWARDFWEPFGWYLRVEQGLPATYFLIPFKRRSGERVAGRRASRRASAYDVDDVASAAATLRRHGGELAVHGIDAWHSVDQGRAELERVAGLSGESRIGIRMHWLLGDADTPRVLEAAGYAWDASLGYNETVGHRNGTTQPFRPAGATRLLELPLQIQDGALFYPERLDLSEREAWTRCTRLVEDAERYGGALTLLWHDRSHAPERFWGDFYVRLVDALKARGAWFGTASEVVEWFARRRAVRFERTSAGVRLRYEGGEIRPPLTVRVHDPVPAAGQARRIDLPWAGQDGEDLEQRLARAATPPAVAAMSGARACA